MYYLTEKIIVLKNRMEELVRKQGASNHWDSVKTIQNEDEQMAYLKLFPEAFRQTEHETSLRYRARLLTLFAEKMPVFTDPAELIQGSQKFTGKRPASLPAEERTFEKVRGYVTPGHVAVDYEQIIRLGPANLQKQIDAMPAGDVRSAMRETITAFRTFIRRHEGCEALADRIPENLQEALQLIWFTQIFLHAESAAPWAVSFGRMDKYLLPYLSDKPEADFEIICAFFLKCCEGDESQNLTLGEVADERLTVMMLEAMRMLKIIQPSISLRIGEKTSENVWNHALALAMEGFGMPAFFHSEVMKEGLMHLGIPPERVEDWAIIGCYEATSPGDCIALTTACRCILPESLTNFLKTGAEYLNFKSFLDAYKHYFRDVYQREYLVAFNRKKEEIREKSAVPFESICLKGCIARNRASTDMGPDYNLFGVNLLGIGTLVDSLLVLKKMVFKEKKLSLREMSEQLEANFPDCVLLGECRRLPGKFGTDSEESNQLAEELSTWIAHEVLTHPLKDGSQPYPGFFVFGHDIHPVSFFATPDGRRASDRLSYGCAPGEFTRCVPTEILNSSAHIAHRLAACGNPLLLSLNKKDSSPEMIRSFVECYFARGGSCLQINIASGKELRDAQKHPEHYPSLLIRISGYSARFVTLDKAWQNALIERTELGR